MRLTEDSRTAYLENPRQKEMDVNSNFDIATDSSDSEESDFEVSSKGENTAIEKKLLSFSRKQKKKLQSSDAFAGKCQGLPRPLLIDIQILDMLSKALSKSRSVLHEVYPSLFFIIPKGIVIEVNNKYCQKTKRTKEIESILIDDKEQ